MNDVLQAIANGAVASLLTTSFVWVLLRLIPRRALNAATRYGVWWAAMAATAAMPLFFVPRSKPVPVIVEAAPSVSSFAPVAPVAAPQRIAPEAAPSPSRAVRPDREPILRIPTLPLQFPSGRWPLWVFTVWVGVTALLVSRLAASFLLLHRICARGKHLPVPITELGIMQDLGTNRSFQFLASSEISTPLAVGPSSPCILLPASLCETLDAGELRQIALHEAAHLARRDDYALVLQRITEALFALHPMVRFISRQIDLEREVACDDLVVAATGNPVSYASCLLRVVEMSCGVRPSLAAATVGEDNSHLSRRVELLLDTARDSGTLLLRGRLAIMIALTSIAVLGAGKMSGLFAFPQPLVAPVARTVPRSTARVAILPLQAQQVLDNELTGTVVDDGTGTALASAELRFRQAGIHELAADIETDRQGRFVARGLQPGEYSIEVLKPNFVPTAFKLRLPSGSPVIRLVRYGVIDGQLTDERGQPMPDRTFRVGGRTAGSTRVTILTKAAGTGGLQVYREAPVADGRYRVFDLPPGEYAVGVWYSGLDAGAGMQLYPDNAHPRFFTILGGEEFTGIDFTVTRRPSSAVRGKVVLPAGVAGTFQLALGLPDQPLLPIAQALTENDGSFRFDQIPPGAYDLFVSGPVGGYGAFESIPGRAEQLYARSRVQVSGQDLNDLTLSLSKPRSLKVALRSHGTDRVPDGCPASAELTAISLEPWAMLFSNRAQAEFGREQPIEGLAPGKFRLEARNLGVNCFQLSAPVVDLTDEAVATVAVEVAAAGSVGGKLKPGADSMSVVLMPSLSTDGAIARVAYPGPDGNFVFEGLPPGSYRIAAHPISGSRTRWVSAGKDSVEVAVKGGARTNVELAAEAKGGGK